MYIRPSKNFLFPILQKELSKVRIGIGLDAASAGMKNRHMFKTDMYVGLDIDRTRLEDGLRKYSDSKTVGLHGDITNLSSIPDNSIEIIASTNTLYVLSSEERFKAISELLRITSPLGVLICEFPITENFDGELKLLGNNFESIKKVYYRNIVSSAYEHIFERDGNLGSHPIAGLSVFRVFSWFLSRFEYITCFSRSLNYQVLLICRGKKTSKQSNNFNLKSVRKVSDRLYSLI